MRGAGAGGGAIKQRIQSSHMPPRHRHMVIATNFSSLFDLLHCSIPQMRAECCLEFTVGSGYGMFLGLSGSAGVIPAGGGGGGGLAQGEGEGGGGCEIQLRRLWKIAGKLRCRNPTPRSLKEQHLCTRDTQGTNTHARGTRKRQWRKNCTKLRKFPRPLHPQPNGWATNPPSTSRGLPARKETAYVHPEAPTTRL